MKLMKDADPFFVKRGKVGVLILHGYTSSPQEMWFLRDILVKNKFTVSCPLLRGHGTKVEDLASVKFTDWLDQVREEYVKLKKVCSKVVIAGSSFGGNLGIVLAPELRPDGLILMGVPYKVKVARMGAVIVPLTYYYQFFKNNVWPKRYNPTELKNVEDKVHYMAYSASNMRQVQKIMFKSRYTASKVVTPSLVMQSTKDRYLPVRNSQRLYNDIISEDKELVFVPDAYHVLAMSKKNKEIALDAIVAWLKKRF